MDLTDYEHVNSAEFINSITARGLGAARINTPFDQVIRRFKLSGAQDAQDVEPGSVVFLDNDRRLLVRYSPMRNWRNVTDEHGTHWGLLHFVFPVIDYAGVPDGLYSCWVEKLRDGERTGTTLTTGDPAHPDPDVDWRFPDGTLYGTAWQVMMTGKLASPVRDRTQERPPYEPRPGSLCAFWVGGWPHGSNRRTDLCPCRYPGTPAPPEEGGGDQVEPPTPPDDSARPELSDDLVRGIFHRGAELMR